MNNILIILLFTVLCGSVMNTAVSMDVQNIAKHVRKMELYEHAAANRELAALTQMEHAYTLEKEAVGLMKGHTDGDIEEYRKAGALRKAAASLYGLAAGNFDKAAANRISVSKISKDIGKIEQYRSSQNYASNMKLRGDEVMQRAANACEAAAVAYDKAGDPREVAANSQMAAIWLEKLTAR
jgi:hypothetical protein